MTGPAVPRVADVRLLAPALLAWSVSAAMLGRPPGERAVLACAGAGLALAGLVVAGRADRATGRRQARGTGRPRHARGTGRPRHGRGHARGRAATVAAHLALTGAVVALVLGFSAAQGWVRAASGLAHLADAGAVVRVEGTVVSDAVRVSGRGTSTWLVRLRVDRVDSRGMRRGSAAVVLVRGDDRWQDRAWHERVAVTGRLSPTEPAEADVAALRPLGAPVVVGRPGVVARVADHLRGGLRRASTPLPPDARGLLPGLVLGDTSRTPTELTDAMRTTSLSHLSAVSGANVAIVLAMVMWLCRLFGVGVRTRQVVGLLAVAGFVVLARPEPSVVRAAVMGSIGLVGILGSRRHAGLPVLGGAVVVILCHDPWLARSAGFVLSTLATLGLLVLARPWSEALDRRLPSRCRGLGAVVAIPAAAQLACAPVIVLLQSSVSVVGVIANALVAPLVAPATLAGVTATVVAPVSSALATVAAWCGGIPALGIAWVARRFAALPWANLPWPDGPTGAVLLAVLSLLVLLTGRWWTARAVAHPLVAGAVALVTAALAVPTAPLVWPPPGWAVVACDVGQGDAIVVRTGDRSALLVDVGPDPRLVAGCLQRLGVERLDGLVLTHFHADHVDGLPGVLDRWPVRTILVSPVRDPPGQVRAVEGWARAHGIRLEPIWAGDVLSFGAVTAHTWWPARRIDTGSVPNNASVVLSVHTGSVDALLLGDVEREAGATVRRALRTTPGAVPAGGFDVVKVAHHGSANADLELMGWVHAPVGLVSVGKDNDYGHPAPSMMALLRRDSYAVWRTDEHGDVAVVETDRGIGVVPRR